MIQDFLNFAWQEVPTIRLFSKTEVPNPIQMDISHWKIPTDIPEMDNSVMDIWETDIQETDNLKTENPLSMSFHREQKRWEP